MNTDMRSDGVRFMLHRCDGVEDASPMSHYFRLSTERSQPRAHLSGHLWI